MSGINDGAFATVCYLSSANVKKTLRGSNVDAFGSDLDTYRTDGDDEYYNTLKRYQGGEIKKFPYNGVVKMSRIQFHWQSEKKYNKNFADYAKKRDDLIVKYGGEPVRKQGTDTKQEYGEGGVSVGDTENTQGRLYTHQNGATVKYLDQNYFLVDTDGRLKGGISKSAISNIISKTGSVDGVSALKKVNASEDDIKSYIDEIKKLNFKVMKLMYESIVFVVATSNNEKIFFWNSKLANQVGSGSYIVNIDPSSFKQKAKELYQKSYEEIRNNSEIMESKKIKISESKLKQIVAESVRKVLNESVKYNGDNLEEYEEIIEIIDDSYGHLCDGIQRLQKWYLINVEGGKDMYNSYAGKYGDESLSMLRDAYNRLGSMLDVEDDDEMF